MVVSGVHKMKSLSALTIMVFIPFGLMIWHRSHQSTGFASVELILYPLLFGGGSIVILYLLKRYFLKEPLSDFNSGPGSWQSDISWGLFLTVLYFILFFIERATLSDLLEFRSNEEMLSMMLDMRQSPLMVLIWLGPVLWIGVALYEELIRIFILTSMWKWISTRWWEIWVILFCAVIIGLVHWSQGPYGIVTITLKGLVSGIFFYKKRRLMPLVYAHGLYDGLQVGALLLTYPEN